MRNGTAAPGEEPDRELSALERMILKAIGNREPMGLTTDQVRQDCPQLWTWLSTVAVGEDKVKSPPRITLTLSPGGVVAQVIDTDLQSALEVSCPHLGDVWSALETALRSPNPPIKRYGRKDAALRKRKREI